MRSKKLKCHKHTPNKSSEQFGQIEAVENKNLQQVRS